MMKPVIMSIAVTLMSIVNAGVTTHLTIDCRTGVRMCSTDGEVLRYDVSWCENGNSVQITDNGTVVTTGVVGFCAWYPASDSSALRHQLELKILHDGQVIAKESAQFALGYVRNVRARQLWPHNNVEVCYTLAADVDEARGANEDLYIWCARGVVTNVATRIIGDRSARPGFHRIVWNMEADGLRFVNAETILGVSVEEIHLGGVQLWENGPYWADRNVGASQPEEYGCYFWWGDTVGRKRNVNDNGWVSARDAMPNNFSSANCPTCGKDMAMLQSLGYIDSLGRLASSHDAATAELGLPWRMPTDEEFAALIRNCTTTWTTRRCVFGLLVTGKGEYSSKSIFLPAAGYGHDADLDGGGSWGYYYGHYWSSTPYSSSYSVSNDRAWYLYFDSGSSRRNGSRSYGQTVRPIREFVK